MELAELVQGTEGVGMSLFTRYLDGLVRQTQRPTWHDAVFIVAVWATMQAAMIVLAFWLIG